MTRVISVCSYREGVGKSSLLASLAMIMAESGKRVGVLNACCSPPGIHALFDADSDAIDHALNQFLDYPHPKDLEEIRSKFEIEVNQGRIILIGGAADLISHSVQVKDLEEKLRQEVDLELLTRGLNRFARRLDLDYLIIDAEAGLNAATLFFLNLSETIILVINLDRQEDYSTSVLIELARQAAVSKILIAVNQVSRHFDPTWLQEKLEDTYGIPVGGVIPLSEDIAVLGGQQIFSQTYPGHPITQILRSIANQIA